MELPSDMFMEIMLKLDVKSLGKCRCVCRSWNKILSAKQFVDMHRQQSILRSSNLILFVGGYVNTNNELQLMWSRFLTFTAADPYTNTNHIDIARRYESSESMDSLHVAPITCDLVCILKNYDIQLWNPSTGQFLTLPTECRCWQRYVVFGYIPTRNEYVVVSVNECKCNQANPCRFAYKYKLTLRNNHIVSSTSWKQIEKPCPRKIRGDGILIDNNFIYWLIQKGEPGEMIVSLDLEKEIFGIINRPPSPSWDQVNLNLYTTLLVTLIDLKGTLCLIDQRVINETGVFELWCLKNSGDHNYCWEKKYNVKLDFLTSIINGHYSSGHFKRIHSYNLRIVYPISSREGELIMSSPDSPNYYLYSPEKNKVRIAATKPLPTADLEPLPGDYLIHLGAGFFCETWLSFA